MEIEFVLSFVWEERKLEDTSCLTNDGVSLRWIYRLRCSGEFVTKTCRVWFLVIDPSLSLLNTSLAESIQLITYRKWKLELLHLEGETWELFPTSRLFRELSNFHSYFASVCRFVDSFWMESGSDASIVILLEDGIIQNELWIEVCWQLEREIWKQLWNVRNGFDLRLSSPFPAFIWFWNKYCFENTK